MNMKMRSIALLLSGLMMAGLVFHAYGIAEVRADEEIPEEQMEEAAEEEALEEDAEAPEGTADAADAAGEEEEGLLETLSYYHIADAYINGITDRRYTGSAIKQTSVVVQHPDAEAESDLYPPYCWKEGVGYKVSYKNNTKAGTATITFTGLENAVGQYSRTFKITNSASWERLAGASGTGALGTQAKITEKFTGSYYAVLATNQNFQDTMAGVVMAGMLKCPLFTTTPNSLSDLVKDELYRLGVKCVFIIGSTNDVSYIVDQQLDDMGVKNVYRAGASNLTPAQRSVSTAFWAMEDFESPSRTLIITTPNAYKDALSISPYAYATGSPIIFLNNDLTLSNEALMLIDTVSFSQAILVGGTKVVPTAVEKSLRDAGVSKITRLGGAGCYNTSRIIAEWEMGKLKNGTNSKTGSLYKYTNVTFQPAVKLGINNVGISRGNGWKDALAGSALCGMYRSVLLLADGSNSANTALVKTYKKNIAKAYVFGGTQAVPAKVYNAFVNASK